MQSWGDPQSIFYKGTLFCFSVLILERAEGRDKHQFVIPLTFAFIG